MILFPNGRSDVCQFDSTSIMQFESTSIMQKALDNCDVYTQKYENLKALSVPVV